MSPEILDGKETGKLISDKSFFRFELQNDGSLLSTNVGNKITPAYYDVDITIPKMEKFLENY